MMSSVFAMQVEQVNVDCLGKSTCVEVIKKFKDFEGKPISKDELYRKLKFELNKPIYKSFYFSFKDNILQIRTELKEKIVGITIEGEDDILLRRIVEDFPVKEGNYYDQNTVDSALEKIKTLYFSNNDKLVTSTINNTDEGIELFIKFSNTGLRKLSDVIVLGVNGEIKSDIHQIFQELEGKVWESVSFKRKIEDIETYLDEQGYWKSSVKYEIAHQKKSVQANVKVSLNRRFGTTFRGNTYFNHYKLMTEMKKMIKNQSNLLSKDIIVQKISELYKDRGVFYTDVSIRKVRGKDKNSAYEMYFVDIKEGQKVELSEVIFSGNREVTTQELEKVYNKFGSTLLGRGYLDIKSLESVTSKIKEFYISKGYIFSSIEDPIIIFGENGDNAFVTFKITESSNYTVNRINISGVEDPAIIADIKKVLNNVEGQEFNVTKVDEDLKNALELVKNKGYFFNSYAEKNPKKIIKVSRASKSVDINLEFRTGKKSYLGDIIVTGNLETKDIVIKRELKVKKGELITPKKMNDFVTRLRSLGLFARVNITPFIGKNKSVNSVYLNFIVKVKEKNFGRGEVAPGFRTDLGYKMSGTVSYNNWRGLNRSFIVKAQANLRTSYSYLDDRRRSEEKDKLEGLVQFKYIEPYLFGNELEMTTSIKGQRKRYSGFDADILSFVPTFTKTFKDKYSLSLKYEYDVIRQFDATLEEDDDRFKIGALTPSITLDYRDGPKKGAWFNFSWEFANPYFGSQNDDDLTINYNRAISRSYFYYPIKNIVLASSLTLGIEKNFARDPLFNADGSAILDSDGQQKTQGFIPSLKVFRLSGRDLLRGFSDDESNVLIDGTDISDVIVRDTAYLVNFKLEPRYYISDNSVFALFFDAGRVFNKSVRFFDLRTSAGISFKVLTPVGSLDFDYGVKLHRDRPESGSRESFGRFHVSIGQF
jgi:outer membrane protein insertion porin family